MSNLVTEIEVELTDEQLAEVSGACQAVVPGLGLGLGLGLGFGGHHFGGGFFGGSLGGFGFAPVQTIVVPVQTETTVVQPVTETTTTLQTVSSGC